MDNDSRLNESLVRRCCSSNCASADDDVEERRCDPFWDVRGPVLEQGIETQ